MGAVLGIAISMLFEAVKVEEHSETSDVNYEAQTTSITSDESYVSDSFFGFSNEDNDKVRSTPKPAARRLFDDIWDEWYRYERVTATPLDNHSIVDVFRWLDRDRLEHIQHASRRFRDVIDKHMSTVCQRPLTGVNLYGQSSTKQPSRYLATVAIKNFVGNDEDSEDFEGHDLSVVVDWLMRRLRCGAVMDDFEIHRLSVTWKLVDQMKLMGSSVRIVDRLILYESSASAGTLRELLTGCFGEVNSFRLDRHSYGEEYFPRHISNELVRAAAKMGVNGVYLPFHKPKFAEHYVLEEDAILEFCFGARARGSSDAPRELKVSYVELTPDFFNKLVEANLWSTQTNRLRLKIKRLRPHNQDTSVYEDLRQQLRQCQLWDFKSDDADAVRFQIFLYQPDHNDPMLSTLELRRWKEPTDGSNFFF